MPETDWTELEAKLVAALRGHPDLQGYRLSYTKQATANMAYSLSIEDTRGEEALSFDGANPGDVIAQALAAIPQYRSR